MFDFDRERVNSCFMPAWNCRCVATTTNKTPAACRDRGIFFESWRTRVRSITADVDGAQAIAKRRQHRTRHVATVVTATDVADAEAVAPVVMITAKPATPSTAKRL